MSKVDKELRLPGLDAWIKPNVRKIFLPDPDHVIFEIDLKQSDAQVVAWDSEEKAQLLDGAMVNGKRFTYKPDNSLKTIFRNGLDLHTTNAQQIYGVKEPTNHQRQMAKHGVHALDLLGTPPTLAKKLDMTIQQARAFDARWFSLHPNIKAWHYWIIREIQRTRTIRNKFGYRWILFGRVESIAPEAVALIPQSTTVNVIDKIMNRIAGDAQNNIPPEVPEVQLLLQVHDSLVGQFHKSCWPSVIPKLYNCTQIEVPYDDPLTIGTDFAASCTSWGAVQKFEWSSFGAPAAAAPGLPP